MKSGSVLKGEVLNWDGQKVDVKGEFGSITLGKEQLDQSTLVMLTAQSSDVSVLQDQIGELEKQVESLLRGSSLFSVGRTMREK